MNVIALVRSLGIVERERRGATLIDIPAHLIPKLGIHISSLPRASSLAGCASIMYGFKGGVGSGFDVNALALTRC